MYLRVKIYIVHYGIITVPTYQYGNIVGGLNTTILHGLKNNNPYKGAESVVIDGLGAPCLYGSSY